MNEENKLIYRLMTTKNEAETIAKILEETFGLPFEAYNGMEWGYNVKRNSIQIPRRMPIVPPRKKMSKEVTNIHHIYHEIRHFCQFNMRIDLEYIKDIILSDRRLAEQALQMDTLRIRRIVLEWDAQFAGFFATDMESLDPMQSYGTGILSIPEFRIRRFWKEIRRNYPTNPEAVAQYLKTTNNFIPGD